MKVPSISVIIPVYNVEEYLSKCLESVLCQTFTDFEAIVVNDGSTDSSAYILQSFAEGDERFKVIAQPNAGLSAARNTGLQLAKGNFVFYLDSDDYLVPDALEILYYAALNYNSSIVQGNFYYDYPTYFLLNIQQKRTVKCYSREQAMWALLKQKTVHNFAWGKLISTELAKKYPFPVGKYFEDTFWMAQIINDCRSYVALKKPLLFYMQRKDGISGSFSLRNIDQLQGHVSRLKLLEENFSKRHYRLGLSQLNQIIISFQKYQSQLLSSEQDKMSAAINNIISEFSLNKKFRFYHLIQNYSLFDFLKNTILRIINCATFKIQWLKITKAK